MSMDLVQAVVIINSERPQGKKPIEVHTPDQAYIYTIDAAVWLVKYVSAVAIWQMCS